MSKKSRIFKKIRRRMAKEWRNANMDEQLHKDFETLLMFGEVWSPHPPSVAELTAQKGSLVRSSVEPSKLILERYASTKKLQNNVFDLISSKNN